MNPWRSLAKFDAIYWTGDLPTHTVWNQTREGQLEKVDALTELFKKYFPGKLIFSTIGNHESAPVDSYPQSIPAIPRRYRNHWLYDKLAVQWEMFLPQDTTSIHSDVYQRASYVSNAFEGLRVISINRNYCDGQNFWAYLNQTDPDGVLHWLVEQLQDAEDAGVKVHIIGHEPTCDDKWKSNDINYRKILNRYESTIAAQFFGHTHTDEYRLYFDLTDPHNPRPTSMQFIGGSITTYARQNPSYRIYTVDARENGTWGVLDYTSRYIDLAESNRQDRVIVKPQYTAKSTYGVDALFVKNMFQIYNKMKTDDSYRQLFNKYYFASYMPSVNGCGESCRRGYLRDIAPQL